MISDYLFSQILPSGISIQLPVRILEVGKRTLFDSLILLNCPPDGNQFRAASFDSPLWEREREFCRQQHFRQFPQRHTWKDVFSAQLHTTQQAASHQKRISIHDHPPPQPRASDISHQDYKFQECVNTASKHCRTNTWVSSPRVQL